MLSAGLLIAALAGCGQKQPVDAPVAAAGPARITGCYSDLYYNEEGGDLIGTEIFIVYAVKGYYALYQESEGEPTVLALFPITVDGNNISFTVPSRGPEYGQFRGTIAGKWLTGRFANSDNDLVLERKESYWQ